MSTETMSSKERLMAALRHEETDRIPWSPLICGYYSLGLPEPLRGNDLEVQRAIGADIVERVTTPVFSESIPSGGPAYRVAGEVPIHGASGNVNVRETWKGNELLRVYETPVGTLRETYQRRETSPWRLFPVEPKIKTVEDLKVFRYIVQARQYQPSGWDAFVQLCKEIGDEGLNTAKALPSPFMTLLQVDIGIERFYYFLADYHDEMVETMEVMHAKNLEACRIVADSPAEVVIIYENTSASLMTPYMYPQYMLPHLNEYVDLLHDAGKLVIMHMCGTLKAVAAQVGEGRYDGICDIAPAPTGDLDLAEAKRAWGDRQVAWGGIDATAFASLSPEEMKAHVRPVLESISPYRGVILGSGDAVPLGTPLETLRAVTEAVKEFTPR